MSNLSSGLPPRPQTESHEIIDDSIPISRPQWGVPPITGSFPTTSAHED
jgi:hypothetical protein